MITVIAKDVPEAINSNTIFTRPAAISSFGIIPELRDGFVAVRHFEERYINLSVSLVLMRSAASPQLLNGIDKEIATSAMQASVTERSVSPPRNDAPVVTVIARDVPEAINPNKIFTRPAAISSFGIIPN